MTTSDPAERLTLLAVTQHARKARGRLDDELIERIFGGGEPDGG